MLHSAEKVGVPARLADLAAKVDLKQDSEDDTTPYSSLDSIPSVFNDQCTSEAAKYSADSLFRLTEESVQSECVNNGSNGRDDLTTAREDSQASLGINASLQNSDSLSGSGSSSLISSQERRYFTAFASPAESPEGQEWWRSIAARLKEHLNSSIPKQEYQEVNDKCKMKDAEVAEGKKKIHSKKNRYGNILPYEQTRVKLKKLEGQDGSDYINASFCGKSGEYIAAQAPTPEAFSDFWRMVYENQIYIVVMLTREIEGDKRKSHRYWPEDVPEVYEDYIVEMKSEEAFEDYCVREFTLAHKSDSKARLITQFHYQAWPDHGVPDESRTILDVVHSVEEMVDSFWNTSTEYHAAPILVHCSAGIGRTGTFCIIHDALRALHRAFLAGLRASPGDEDTPDAGLDEIDHTINKSLSRTSDEPAPVVPISLQGTLMLLREQRYGMVTQCQQYLFCYEAILEEVMRLSGERTIELQVRTSGQKSLPSSPDI